MTNARLNLRINKKPNECGECTLCCKLMAVNDLDPKKPVNEWCVHSTMKSGCKIYPDRPGSCKIFTCQWLSSNFPANLRPDRIHGVLTGAQDEKTLVIHEDPGYPGVASTRLKEIIDSFVRSGKNYVIVQTGEKRRLIGPPGFEEKMNVEFIKTDDGTDVRITPRWP